MSEAEAKAEGSIKFGVWKRPSKSKFQILCLSVHWVSHVLLTYSFLISLIHFHYLTLFSFSFYTSVFWQIFIGFKKIIQKEGDELEKFYYSRVIDTPILVYGFNSDGHQRVTFFPSTLYIVTNVILLLFSELAFYLPWSMFTLIGIESVEKKNTFRPI